MLSFRQYLEEALYREASNYRKKGWINIKSNKMVLWNSPELHNRPYHSEYVAKKPEKFFRGGKEEAIRKFAKSYGLKPEEEEVDDLWQELAYGDVDRDDHFDDIMRDSGWFRVVFERGASSFETENTQQGIKVAKIIAKEIPWDNIGTLQIFDRGDGMKRFDSYKEAHSEDDLFKYIKTGQIPKRTDIGRTMAMFR